MCSPGKPPSHSNCGLGRKAAQHLEDMDTPTLPTLLKTRCHTCLQFLPVILHLDFQKLYRFLQAMAWRTRELELSSQPPPRPTHPRALVKPSSPWEVSVWMSASVCEVMLLKVVLRVTRSLRSWESDEVEGTVSTKTDHVPPVQL
jgi:hypothetical protein